MDISSRQKTNKATDILKGTREKVDFFDIFRTRHPKKAEYTFFSNAHGTLSRIDHILGHKANLNKFRSVEKKKYSEVPLHTSQNGHHQ